MQQFLAKVIIAAIQKLLSLFFRQIEIINADRVPDDTPIIFTPNHTNSLIDGLLARVFLPRDPRAMAKATLWNNPVLNAVLTATNSIPVHRQQDAKGSEYAEKNLGMFSSCHEALSQNDSIVLFPEGTSHDEPEIQPLKTGAARIALGAEQEHGPLGVRIVPVGLIFDAKQKFRSRVLISIGEPFDPLEDIDDIDPDNREAVSQLTDRIEEGIKSVTLNYPSWEEANFIKRAADLYVSPRAGESAGGKLADEFHIHKQLADAYPKVKAAQPRKATRIIEAVKAYDRLLKVLSIQHEHLIQGHPRIIKASYNLRKLSLFLIRLPLALLGIALNAIPFYLTRIISRFKFPVHRTSTVKLFLGLILFPLCWTLESMVLGGGLWPPFIWWLLAPISGLASMLFLERHNQLLEELRAYLRLKNQAEIKEELEERLNNVDLEVTELLNTAESLE